MPEARYFCPPGPWGENSEVTLVTVVSFINKEFARAAEEGCWQSTKTQTPSTRGSPIPKLQQTDIAPALLGIGTWSFLWGLVIGIWGFAALRASRFTLYAFALPARSISKTRGSARVDRPPPSAVCCGKENPAACSCAGRDGQ